jgi:hypothetical protein
MDSQEFSRQLKELQKQIFYAFLSYNVYIALWPTEEVVNTLDRHRGFFIPVQNALYDTMIMGFAKVFDRDRRTMSLVNLLREAKDSTVDLVPHLSISDIQAMEYQLSQHEHVRASIKNLRDQKLAHSDANPKPSRPPKKGEMDNLIKTVEEVFNELSSGHDKSVYSWSFQQNRSTMDTSEVIRILRAEMDKTQS